MMEGLLGIEITQYRTITEEIERVWTVTGFRSRFSVHSLGEGFLAAWIQG